MNETTLEFQRLRSLLRRRADDEELLGLIGGDLSAIQRNEYYGSVELRDAGVDLVFKEARWVIPRSEVTDAGSLYVCGFHLHRQGHEGFSEYLNPIWGDVEFNDSEAGVRDKLGMPAKTGGGQMSTLLGKPVPGWMCYDAGDALIHFQFDVGGTLEMVTLFVETPI